MKSMQSGLTLIELMVTVAISAILLGFAAPSFISTLARQRLEGAAGELAANLASAATDAISRNGPVALVTSGDGRSYSVNFGGATLKTLSLPTGVTVTASTTVTYQPARGDSNAADLVLSSSGTTSQLQVSTNTVGRVQVCTPNGSFSGYTTC